MRISDLLAFAAMRAPHVTALEFEGRTWTYTELYADVCRLARYKCPRDVVVVPELPRNTVGKVLKRQLRSAVEREVTGR